MPTYTGLDTLGKAAFETVADFAAGWQPVWTACADFDGDGKGDIFVVSSASNSAAIYRNISTVSNIRFEINSSYLVWLYFRSIATADVDGDGKPEVVMTSPSDNKVAVFRNTSSVGAISFAQLVEFITDASPGHVAVADMNGDGKPDIVTANSAGKTLSIFTNQGSVGTIALSARIDRSTGTLVPRSVSLRDLTGDQLPEMVAACENPGGVDSVSVFRNGSTGGSINLSDRLNFATGEHVTSITSGDVDLDGRNDLLVTSMNPGLNTIYRNTTENNSLSLTMAGSLPAATDPGSLSLGDLDGDGKPDLAQTSTSSGNIAVFRNKSEPGTIAFNKRVEFPAGYTPSDLLITDINQDGKPDIAVSNQVGSKLIVLRNVLNEPVITSFTPTTGSANTLVTIKGLRFTNVNGVSFGGVPALLYTVLNDSTITATVGSGATGNLLVTTAKGRSEKSLFVYGDKPTISSFTPAVGAAGSAVTITGGNFSPIPTNNIVYFGAARAIITAASSTSITALVPTAATYQPISVTTNGHTAYSNKHFLVSFPGLDTLQANSYSVKTDLVTGAVPRSVSIADLDGDGKSDFAVLNNVGETVSVFRNTGEGGELSFSSRIDSAAGSNPFFVLLEDLTGDGRKELIIANYGGNNVMVYKNTSVPGTLSFGNRVTFPTGENPIQIAVRDFNNDGKPDLATVNNNGHSISILTNISTQNAISFTSKIDFSTGQWPMGISADDLDGDQKADIVVANHDGLSISVLKNTSSQPGNLNFATKVDYPVDGKAFNVLTRDMDGDGRIDILAANSDGGKIAVFRNLSTPGTITLANRIDHNVIGKPVSLAAGDLDGDGKPDLAD